MRVVLLRHPRPKVPAGICYGRTDLPLHEAGLAAIPAMVRQAGQARPVCVWSSPAQRCLILAQALADAQNIPVRVDVRLQELHFGDWEMRDWHSVPRESLDTWATDPIAFAPPGGESGADLLARVQSVFDAVRADEQDCAIVSHGGPLKLLVAMLRNDPIDLLAAPPPIGAVMVLPEQEVPHVSGEHGAAKPAD